MGLADIGSNIAASLTGGNKKAFLVLYKEDALTEAGNLTDITAYVLGEINPGSSAKQAASTMARTGTHIMQVQYNPASLAIQSNASEIPMMSLQTNVNASVPNQQVRPPSVQLSAELIFDAVNVKDSFMADRFRLSASDMVTGVAAVVNRAKYTVQPQTNALLAMLLKKGTNRVSFYWANLSFHGLVESASARYTMFSLSGRPVRSVVTLRIQQELDEDDKTANTYWDKAFDKCFGEAGDAGDFGGKGAGQQVGNMLNLGF